MYLDLLKKCLMDSIYNPSPGVLEGKEIPERAITMVGEKRLASLDELLWYVDMDEVEGDLVDCGTWRGGCAILMRGFILYQKYLDDMRCERDAEGYLLGGVETRNVWVCDSFEGLPPPEHPADAGDKHYTRRELAVSLEEVQENFRRFGLLDDRVKFLKGWFKDTLPDPIEKIALLRIDGDMYGSTMDVLTALYDKVSPGGYIIVDDYKLKPCKQAVDEFRASRGITDPIEIIDWTGIYWRKNGA